MTEKDTDEGGIGELPRGRKARKARRKGIGSQWNKENKNSSKQDRSLLRAVHAEHKRGGQPSGGKVGRGGRPRW